MFLIMGLCFGIVAVGLLVGAIWVFVKQQRTMNDREQTTGTVVDLVSRTTASARSSIICPVVEFTAPSGEKIRFTSDFGSLPASHKVGQTVNLRYDPVDPHQAEIDSTMNRWLVPAILVFIGLIACCLATVFLVVYGLGNSSFAP
jgi:high-affinity Fe2+/Pb2+ permease